MSRLVLANLTVRYAELTAVDAASLTVEPGEVVGLVGESGSGKSTLARAIVGLAPISAGIVEIGGVRVDNARRRQRASAMRSVQMIFQDPTSALDPRFTITQCIAEAFQGEGFNSGSASRKGRVTELLEKVALDPAVAHLKPTQLSGGQRQRVAIARALAGNPGILIADEVTASLDVSVQAIVLNLLRGIQREQGLTMLFISHNLAVVRYMSDHIAVMYQGRIVERGATDEIISNPQHPYTQTLLEAVPKPGHLLAALPKSEEDTFPRERLV
jgi:peptide/nickel transport system ATP-binding protein